MSYIAKDKSHRVHFTIRARNDYNNSPIDYRDSVLMDMLGEMGFGCGKSRWDSPILFTHIESRKIVVAVQCPPDVQGWDGCPYTTPNPGQTFAFVHEQGYEIRIIDKNSDGFKGVIFKVQISRQPNSEHWFELPKNIRVAWDSSL